MSDTITTNGPRPKTPLEEKNNLALGEVDYLGGIDPANEIKGARLLVLHSGLCLCTFLVGLDFNIIATAIPTITSDFNSIDDVGWYGAAFFIALCSTTPLAGSAFTLFPKRIVYLSYLALFEIGSLVCALSPTSIALIAGRVVTGLGASGIFAGGLILLTTIIPLHKRAVWTGTMNSTFVIASIIGPLLGGALTDKVSWRWCFYINLPIGGLSGAFVLLFCAIKRDTTENIPLLKKLKSLDGIGFVLFSGSISMLLIALQLGGVEFAWKSSQIIGLFVGFVLAMFAFVAWQLFLQDQAMIPPRLFAHRNAGLIFVSALFSNGPFQTIIYWLPIWFQVISGTSPTASGVRYLPTVLSDVLTSVFGAGLAQKLGIWNPFLLSGAVMMSIGGGLLTTLHPAISSGHWIGFQIFGGIGYSLTTTMAHLGMQASLPPELVPIGATTLLFGISASCAVFLAVGQAVFQQGLSTQLSEVVGVDVVKQVLSAGATQVRSVVNAKDLNIVIEAYNKAVTQVFYIPAAGPAISFILVCFAKWTLFGGPSKKDSDSPEKPPPEESV